MGKSILLSLTSIVLEISKKTYIFSSINEKMYVQIVGKIKKRERLPSFERVNKVCREIKR